MNNRYGSSFFEIDFLDEICRWADLWTNHDMIFVVFFVFLKKKRNCLWKENVSFQLEMHQKPKFTLTPSFSIWFYDFLFPIQTKKTAKKLFFFFVQIFKHKGNCKINVNFNVLFQLLISFNSKTVYLDCFFLS